MVRLPVTIATSTGRPGYCFTCQPSRRATDSTRQGSALRDPAGLFRWLQQLTHLLEVSAQRRQEVPESASTKIVLVVSVRSAQQSDLRDVVIVMVLVVSLQ